MFIDSYIVSDSQDLLKGFCAAYPNVIGPRCGMPAVPEQVLDNGLVIEAQAALGDPTKYYACIRTSEPQTLPEGIAACEASEGSALLGVWA